MPGQTGGDGGGVTPDTAPLILTLEIDEATFDRLDALRRAHFPAHLNVISAHLTLFHHLPGDRFDAVVASVERTAKATQAFPIAFTGLRKLGRGVALNVEAEDIAKVRSPIAADFADALTAQDQQSRRPHVTIQNKVDPKVAAALHDELTAAFIPWQADAVGLRLWHYRNGPWEAAGRFAFRDAARTSG